MAETEDEGVTVRRLLVLAAILPTVLGGVLSGAVAAPTTISLTVTTTEVEVGQSYGALARVGGLRAGKRFDLQQRVGGRWTRVASIRTRSDGVETTIRPTIVGVRRLRAVATDGRRTVRSSAIVVKVVPPRSIVLRASSHAVPAGSPLRLTGRLSGARRGDRVAVERRAVDGDWETVGDVAVAAQGSFGLDTLVTGPGVSAFRARSAASPGRAAAVSPTVEVPVERVAGVVLGRDTTWDARTAATVVLDSDLVVEAGSTLTIEPGVSVLAHGHSITVRGRLVAGQGGVTSLQHDASAAQTPGSWPGLVVADEAVADLGRTAFAGAATAITAARTSRVTWHGAVRDTRVGVSAPSYVDATDVDWGSSDGPAPYGRGAEVEGYGVRVVPWRDYRAPTASLPVLPQADPECTDVRFLAARGSGQPPQDGDYDADPLRGAWILNYSTAEAASRMLQSHAPGTTWSWTGVRYVAAPLHATTEPGGWAGWSASLGQGATGLRDAVRTLHRECPDTSIVLLGQSQGAGVVRRAAQDLDRADRAAISAVVLFADFTRVAGEDVTLLGSSGAPAPRALVASRGLVRMSELSSGAADLLPSDLASRTLSICREDDVVCHAVPGATIQGHFTYDTEEVGAAARWVADLVASRRGPG